MNPSDLSALWKRVNDFLSVPFVQAIAVPIVLGLISLAFKTIRDPVLRRVKAAWTAARQRVGKLAQDANQRFLEACRSLGLVTRDDLAALEDRLKAAIPAAGPASPKTGEWPDTVERLGVKFALDPGIRSALGKKDPARVDQEYIYVWLQAASLKPLSLLFSSPLLLPVNHAERPLIFVIAERRSGAATDGALFDVLIDEVEHDFSLTAKSLRNNLSSGAAETVVNSVRASHVLHIVQFPRRRSYLPGR